jgi:hypothetical protein
VKNIGSGMGPGLLRTLSKRETAEHAGEVSAGEATAAVAVAVPQCCLEGDTHLQKRIVTELIEKEMP